MTASVLSGVNRTIFGLMPPMTGKWAAVSVCTKLTSLPELSPSFSGSSSSTFAELRHSTAQSPDGARTMSLSPVRMGVVCLVRLSASIVVTVSSPRLSTTARR